MIKIAYVINYIVKNGPSSVVLNLINNLDRARYSVSLITLFSGNDVEVVEVLKNAGVTVFACTGLTRMGCILGRTGEFTDMLYKEHFDILHTHGFIPDILSSRVDCPIKKITTIHDNMYEDYLACYGYFRSRIFIALHLAALKKLDKCVCCSKSVYDVMQHKINNVSYIRNGIRPTKEHSIVTREEIEVPENARLFLYAGALSEGKNIVWLIKEFVEHHSENEYLLVLGSGEKEVECKEKADDHVRMLGFQTDPIAYMNISDVYVSASKSEGFSISVLEALSCGMLLLLSDIPSHREVIEMGKDVYLGELFLKETFNEAFQKMKNRKLQKKEVADFQRNELSDKVMAKKYILQYEDGGKENGKQ